MKTYKTSEALPPRSGAYLCLSVGGVWQVLEYSKKHQAFNAYDNLNDTGNSIGCSHWAALPEVDE